MKKLNSPILLGLFAAATAARAATPLTITSGSPYGCLQNAALYSSPLTASGSFSLNGVAGTGTVQSSVPGNAPTFGYPPTANIFVYTIDVSHLSAAAGHCVKLLVHFGSPDGCGYQEVFGDPTAIQSATLAPFGDITFVFAGGCLTPGQPAVGFTMFSEAAPKTGVVTVIDDYFDPASGQTNETRINVSALVPDIPPNPPPWMFLSSFRIPYAFFQGALNNNSNNPAPPFTNGLVNGAYDFTLQLLHAPTNGLATSQLATQTVQVVNGLFNLPLPFDPISMGDGSAHWLSLGVRPSGLPAVQFTPLNPPLPLTPTPQAFYADTAGSVADLAPGQAVTSLNGLTDAVNLQAGGGIVLGTNGNTITVSAQPGVVSDRNLKADFTTVQPEEILARLVALPIQGWRYTNEVAGVRHVGPMAQDFKAAFGLGDSDKMIGFVDGQGVALAAIQGLNGKIESGKQKAETRMEKLEGENAELKLQLAELKILVQQLAREPQK